MLEGRRGRATNETLRAAASIENSYRSWQLIFQRLNQVPDIAVCGQHFLIAVLLILCSFSTIQFSGMHNFESIPAFISYAIFPAATAIFFGWILLIQPQAAEITVACQEFKFKWRQHLRMEQLRMGQHSTEKYVRSCRDIVLCVGPFFHYKVSTMPQVQDECVDKTITLLLGV